MQDDKAERALDEPVTERAFRRSRRRARVMFGLWGAAVFLLPLALAAVVEGLGGRFSDGLVIPAAVVGLAGAALWSQRVADAAKIGRVLAVYPWQTLTAVVHVHEGRVRVRVPHPEHRGQSIALPVSWTERRRWQRAVRRNAADEIRLAGDPRFAAVVAFPGPHGFTFVTNPVPPPPAGFSPEAVQRARQARISD